MKEQEALKTPGRETKAADGGPSSASGPKKHPVLVISALVGVVLCAWLLVHLFSKPKAKPPAPAGIPVSTGAAKTGDINIYIDALGTVTPVYTVTVTSRVAGELTEVLYNEGQMVKKDDLL